MLVDRIVAMENCSVKQTKRSMEITRQNRGEDPRCRDFEGFYN